MDTSETSGGELPVISSHEMREVLKGLPEQEFFGSKNEYLDNLIGGFAEGDLVVIGGNTGAGKTTLLQTWTRQFAEQGIACMWFSIELSAREFLGRFREDLPIFFMPRVMPTATTHTWLEEKMLEAKGRGVKVVFLDHIGMIADEAVMRHQNAVGILDERIMRLKRFALRHKVCLIAVSPLVQTHLRAKKKEPSEGDFRGSAMIAYTADTLLHLDRLEGKTAVETVNDSFHTAEEMQAKLIVPADSYLHVLKARRTGVKKVKIKLTMVDGNLVEASS